VDSLFAAVLIDRAGIPDTFRSVSGLQAAQTFFWRVSGTNGSGTGPWSATRRFTTQGSSAGEFSYNPDWNLISLPFSVANGAVQSLFPAAISIAYSFEPDAGYLEQDSLLPGTGYWLKFPSDQTVGLSGTLRTLDTVQVQGGWTMVGTLSVPVAAAAVIQHPPGLIEGGFFGFDGSYVSVDTLQPGTAYWVKTTGPGTLIFTPQPRDQQAGKEK
jgi:hypothetical protein